jgi:predicted transcriptional regulator/heme-degrading monooxygenase HmoA
MPDRIPEETKKEIRELYKQGNTPKWIARETGVSYSSVYGLTLAVKRGFKSNTEYHKFLVQRNNFATLGEYADYLARQKGFKSYSQYRIHELKKQGFPTVRAYYDFIAQQLGFKSHRDRLAKIAQSKGFASYSQMERQKIKEKYKTYIRYEDELAMRKGFKSNREREKERARKRGFESIGELNKHSIKQMGFASKRDYERYLATEKLGFKTVGEYEKDRERKRQQKPVNQELSSLIKSSLEKLDRNQTWLARQLGVSDGAVSRYVSGKTTPRPGLQLELFKTLKLPYKTLDDIMQRSD